MAQAGMRYSGVDVDKYGVRVVPADMANDNGQRAAFAAKIRARGFTKRATASCVQIDGDVYVRKIDQE